MALPEDYWNTYEHTVDTLASFLEAVETIAAYQAATSSRFVWRGVGKAHWPLHSSLVRSLIASGRPIPPEAGLRQEEEAILTEAREWRLDWRDYGARLNGLQLLAALQHFGGPTRLIDFTFNPLIALWFAVERHDGDDGRVFAIDIGQRLIADDKASMLGSVVVRRGCGR